MIYILLLFLTTLFSAVLISILIKIAHRFEWYDTIDDRKIHTENIPRIGGVGIIVSFFSVSIIFLLIDASFFKIENIEPKTRLWSFFIISFLVSLIGIIDDFKNLKAKKKLIGQIFLTVIVIYSGHYFKEIYIPFVGITVSSAWLGIVVTFFWIIGVTNAVNLIDGMDGLSSGLAIIPVMFFAIVEILYGNFVDAAVLFSLTGAILGFLFFNFPPAKIFMGDGGSLFLGFIVAVIPLYFSQNIIFASALPILSISVAFIPIYDTLAAITRRKLRGISFFIPDNDHLHHKLLGTGLTTSQVLFVLYLLSVSFLLPGFFYIVTLNKIFLDILVIMWIIMTIIFLFITKLKKNELFEISTLFSNNTKDYNTK